MIDQKAVGGSVVLLFLGAVLILTAGGLFVAWLADINIDKGIGGQSLFIVPGLLMNIPAMLISGQTESVHLSQNFYDWFGYSDFNLYLSNAFPLQCRIPHQY